VPGGQTVAFQTVHVSLLTGLQGKWI